ncbi:MAG TPA: hypothetical protein VHY31_28800 [Streptosporangiaceae bacterium]|nr:hypothetical protein [Streptosporangiaceae bacterium]
MTAARAGQAADAVPVPGLSPGADAPRWQSCSQRPPSQAGWPDSSRHSPSRQATDMPGYRDHAPSPGAPYVRSPRPPAGPAVLLARTLSPATALRRASTVRVSLLSNRLLAGVS